VADDPWFRIEKRSLSGDSDVAFGGGRTSRSRPVAPPDQVVDPIERLAVAGID
jgi:hypothetical protein